MTMKDTFKRLEELCNKLFDNGFCISKYAKKDIENERTDREIIILSTTALYLKFENSKLRVETKSSNMLVDDSFVMQVNYLNDIKNEFNAGKELQ